MKTKSIIYNSFVPQVKTTLTITQNESPTFKYTGYKPRYKWSDDDSTTEDTTTETNTSNPEDTSTSESTSDQITFEDPSSIDWSKVTGYESQPTITESQSATPVTKQQVQHIFKDPSIQVGEMQGLLDAFADAGISLRITSGTRPGATTKQGKLSNHALGRALDITPVVGQTPEDFKDLAEKIRNSPDLVKYMQDHGYGILDETTPEALARTGGTGAHWHIGPDKAAIAGLETILKGKQGLKIPILFAKEGTKNKSVVQQLLNTPLKSTVIGNQFSDLDPAVLKRYADVATDFVPILGDAKEVYNISRDIKNKNYFPATISTLSFILPGNFFNASRKLGFTYPHNKWDYVTNSGNIIKDLGIDKEIKNTESLLAKRYSTKENRIPELPQELNGEQVSNIIQEWEPQIREVLTPEGKRHTRQVGWYKHDKVTNQPIDLSIGDKNLTTKELNTEFTPDIENYLISEDSRRQMLDHEISHWLDDTFRPEIKNSEIDFLNDWTEEAIKDPTEIIARTGQVKSYNKISDGSQTFTGGQYKQMFGNYINDKRNPDNYISLLKRRIKDWNAFAKWANENIPLATKPLKPFLWNPENSEDD